MKHIYIALVMLALPSCVADVDPSSNDDAPLADDAIVYDTVATVGPDGQVVLSPPRPITVGEQRAQAQARLETAPSIIANGYGLPSTIPDQDYACLDTSLWVYSRTDFTGDRICFASVPGDLGMPNYSRYVTINGHAYYAGTWQISSGSFLTGDRGGYFYVFDHMGGKIKRTFSTLTYAGTFQFSSPLDGIHLN